MRRISTISLSPRRPQSLRFPPSSRSAAPPTSAPALKFFARIPGRSHALPSSCRLCILCASIPSPSLSRPRPVPSPRPPSRTRIFSRVHLSPASLQKQETAAAFRSSLARPASSVRAPAVFHSAGPHAVCSPTPPCGRRESPHSRPSLLLPLPPPPESNEPAPHSRGIPPTRRPASFNLTLRPAPTARTSTVRENLTPRPTVSGPAPRPFAASSVPHLLSAAPSLRPQSRSLQPPALEPPSVSPCSRPASAPAPRRPVRCPPAAGFPRRPQSLRFPRFSAIRSPSVLCACPEILCSRPRPPPSSSRVSRVSAEVDLSAQTARTASAFSAFPLCSRH